MYCAFNTEYYVLEIQISTACGELRTLDFSMIAALASLLYFVWPSFKKCNCTCLIFLTFNFFMENLGEYIHFDLFERFFIPTKSKHLSMGRGYSFQKIFEKHFSRYFELYLQNCSGRRNIKKSLWVSVRHSVNDAELSVFTCFGRPLQNCKGKSCFSVRASPWKFQKIYYKSNM